MQAASCDTEIVVENTAFGDMNMAEAVEFYDGVCCMADDIVEVMGSNDGVYCMANDVVEARPLSVQ